MNRITSVFGLITLASVATLSPTAQAQGNDVQLLKSRVSALESRVAVLENAAATGITNVGFYTPAEKAPVAESESYVIKEGDTISEVARRNSVPRSLLMEENGLREGQQIYIGDRLNIPVKPKAATPAKPSNVATTKPKTSAPTNAGGHTFYTVKLGDNLTEISRNTGASIASIKAANGLRSDVIDGGQRLKIPSKGSALVSPPTTPQLAGSPSSSKSATAGKAYDNPKLADSESYGEYTVEKGDNLYALARDFFTTMKELQRINGLGASTLIFPGSKLIVPTGKYNEYHNKVATR